MGFAVASANDIRQRLNDVSAVCHAPRMHTPACGGHLMHIYHPPCACRPKGRPLVGMCQPPQSRSHTARYPHGASTPHGGVASRATVSDCQTGGAAGNGATAGSSSDKCMSVSRRGTWHAEGQPPRATCDDGATTHRLVGGSNAVWRTRPGVASRLSQCQRTLHPPQRRAPHPSQLAAARPRPVRTHTARCPDATDRRRRERGARQRAHHDGRIRPRPRA